MIVVNKEYELHCDVVGCYYTLSSKSYTTKIALLINAGKLGWVYKESFGKVMCPHCVKNGKKFQCDY